MRSTLACAVLAALAFVSGRVNAASWKASGFSQSVIMGIGFSDENNGFIAGGQTGSGANVLRTTDGAKTFEIVPILGPTMMLLGCASMGPDSAVATGLGLGQGGGQFLRNGAFNTSAEAGVIMQSGQDVSIIGDGEGYAQAFAGATTASNSTDQVNGLLVSYDNGASFTLSMIPGNGTANPVRYSSVPSKSVAFVTSGTWPANTQKKYGKFLTRNIHLHHQKHKMLMHFEKKADLNVRDDGWVAGIFRSNDAFETWTQVFSNETFYFNEIACASEKICIAAGENDAFGLAYRTTDGGESWEEVLAAPGVSLMGAAAISEDEFFVGGGVLGQTGIEGHVYHTTDGGDTFELETITGYYLTSLSMVSSTRGFATAMDMMQQSDVLIYA